MKKNKFYILILFLFIFILTNSLIVKNKIEEFIIENGNKKNISFFVKFKYCIAFLNHVVIFKPIFYPDILESNNLYSDFIYVKLPFYDNNIDFNIFAKNVKSAIFTNFTKTIYNFDLEKEQIDVNIKISIKDKNFYCHSFIEMLNYGSVSMDIYGNTHNNFTISEWKKYKYNVKNIYDFIPTSLDIKITNKNFIEKFVYFVSKEKNQNQEIGMNGIKNDIFKLTQAKKEDIDSFVLGTSNQQLVMTSKFEEKTIKDIFRSNSFGNAKTEFFLR